MEKSEQEKLLRLMNAYESVGILLLQEIDTFQASVPLSMSTHLFVLRNHTKIMAQLVDRAYQNTVNDTPGEEGLEGFRVKLSCGITLGLGNCKTREDAIAQVESGQHDEMIGQQLAQLCKDNKHNKVLEIEPLFKEE